MRMLKAYPENSCTLVLGSVNSGRGMVEIKVVASDEEINDIRRELVQWETEEIIEHLNFVQGALDYENPEKTRDGWLFFMFGKEALGYRNVAFVVSPVKGGS